MPKQDLSPAVILVSPQMGENIGAAARAMLNFGLTDLRLVNPRDGWPNQAAIDMSSGALEKMPPVTVFSSLAEAAADCNYVYGTTARKRDMVKKVFTPRGAVNDAAGRAGQKTAFVFGPERTGLENDDIALCHAVITVPSNPDFWSLNLGQTVLLMSYEWMITKDQTKPQTLHTGDSIPAPHDKLDKFLARLEEELEAGQFFNARELKPTMIRNIRSMFMRAELTEQEVRTFHGIVSALNGKKEVQTRNKKAAQ